VVIKLGNEGGGESSEIEEKGKFGGQRKVTGFAREKSEEKEGLFNSIHFW
jgi:hypothetical protein